MRSFFLKLLSQFGRNRTEHYQLHAFWQFPHRIKQAKRFLLIFVYFPLL